MKFANLPPEKRIEHYEWNFQAHLGSGSFAKVYLGKDINTKDYVAIKILDANLMKDEYMKSTLNNEVQILKSMKSLNIVQLFDVFMTKNNIYIMQEFCNGGDLRNYMTKVKKDAIKESEAIKILRDLICGFRILYNHSIVHRDLKPENILRHDEIFKIADFGFARSIDDTKAMMTSMVGTPLYMSPKILQNLSYSMKSDVWSLGTIYYEIICGKTPWPSKTQYELINKILNEPLRFPHNISITDDSKDFIKKCVTNDEKERLSWEDCFKHSIMTEVDLNKFQPRRTTTANVYDNQAIEIIKNLQKVIKEKNISLEKLFAKLDKSGDNMLDVKEFSRLVRAISPNCAEEVTNYLFERWDIDKSGSLSFDEFKKMINEKDYNTYIMYIDPMLEQKAGRVIQRLVDTVKADNISIVDFFLKFDNKKKSALDLDELHSMMMEIDSTITLKEAEYIFDLLDENKDGGISLVEFQAVFKSKTSDNMGLKKEYTKKMSLKADNAITKLKGIVRNNKIDLKMLFEKHLINGNKLLTVNEFANLITKIDAYLSKDEILEVFNDFDIDGNGTIDVTEFQTVMIK